MLGFKVEDAFTRYPPFGSPAERYPRAERGEGSGTRSMRTVCLVTPVEEPDRAARARTHFAEVGLGPVDYFHGLHKSTSGLDTDHLYMVDRGPGSPDEGIPYRIGKHPVNIWIGHYFLWQALKLSRDSHWFIVECDAKFPLDAQRWLRTALSYTRRADPEFDLLFVGNCCCGGRPTTRGAGDRTLGIYTIHGSAPQCTHAYVIATKAVPVLEATLRKVWAPIDVQQTDCFEHGVPLPRAVAPVAPPPRKLKVYAVLPRIVDQWETELPV